MNKLSKLILMLPLALAPQRRDAGIYDLGQTVRELGPDTTAALVRINPLTKTQQTA